MRLIQGRWGWWCITASGTALVPEAMVHEGELTATGLAGVESVGLLTPRPARHYSLTVVTATACNLGCPYCFQNTGPAATGRFDPPRIERAVLDASTMDAIASFTRARMSELGVERLHVLLFGGEPLLNAKGCREVLGRCGEVGHLTGAMVTNGVLLQAAVAKQLYDAGLRTVQITLDGPQQTHDQVRTTRRGGGTYAGIVSNIAAAQECTGLDFTLRINVTPSALTGLYTLITDLSRVLDADRCTLGISPVLDYGWGYEGVLRPTATTARSILDAYAWAHEQGFRVARPGHGGCDFCTEERGARGAVVNADGTLFSCWESIGQTGYDVGTVHTGYTGYPPDRWVSCGALSTATSATRSGLDRVTDEIDAGLLDLTRLWRLGTSQAR